MLSLHWYKIIYINIVILFNIMWKVIIYLYIKYTNLFDQFVKCFFFFFATIRFLSLKIFVARALLSRQDHRTRSCIYTIYAYIRHVYICVYVFVCVHTRWRDKSQRVIHESRSVCYLRTCLYIFSPTLNLTIWQK